MVPTSTSAAGRRAWSRYGFCQKRSWLRGPRPVSNRQKRKGSETSLKESRGTLLCAVLHKATKNNALTLSHTMEAFLRKVLSLLADKGCGASHCRTICEQNPLFLKSVRNGPIVVVTAAAIKAVVVVVALERPPRSIENAARHSAFLSDPRGATAGTSRGLRGPGRAPSRKGAGVVTRENSRRKRAGRAYRAGSVGIESERTPNRAATARGALQQPRRHGWIRLGIMVRTRSRTGPGSAF